MKLGKSDPTPIKLQFVKYWDKSKLPTPPSEGFGHEGLVTGWKMLANDKHSCCVLSGAAHEHMLFSREGGNPVDFTDANVLDDYHYCAGFIPWLSWVTDWGTNLAHAADYRRKYGIVDSTGKRHKIDAYVALPKGDTDALLVACYLFSAVGIGFRLPHSAKAQFQQHLPWTVTGDWNIAGGHYTPMVAFRNNFMKVITWGREQDVNLDFYRKFNDESFVYLTTEMLKNNKSLEGFDFQQLSDDLKAL